MRERELWMIERKADNSVRVDKDGKNDSLEQLRYGNKKFVRFNSSLKTRYFSYSTTVGWSLGFLANDNSSYDMADSRDFPVDCSCQDYSNRDRVFAFAIFLF